MATYKGTPETVGELIKVLEQFPADKPVRVQTMSHTMKPDVYEHERCIMITP